MISGILEDFVSKIILLNTFQAHNISEIFTLCGGHITPVLVAAKNIGIKVYDTRHEANAVFAADAVARLRQGIGVAVVTAGPGRIGVQKPFDLHLRIFTILY